ncbi:hypothetical protein [Wolbachia endosymbiont of Oedothorax gibbosus]|nr:hypothetical protein [Wolbachia endosymbiont of Oedothorax gibbosus]
MGIEGKRAQISKNNKVRKIMLALSFIRAMCIIHNIFIEGGV